MRLLQSCLLVTCLFSLTLAGCAQKVWYKPGITQAQFERDMAEVRYEAMKSTPPDRGLESPIAAGIGDGFHQAEVIKAGMAAKGYRLIDKSDVPVDP